MGSEKPQRSTPFLIIRDGAGPDRLVIWDTVEITVGRLESQDIAVPESEVSRKHCVYRQKGGVFTLEDLGSALGTVVRGEPVKVHELRAGDVAEVGSVKIKFGQTTSPIKPGPHVRFASQLRGGSGKPDEPEDASGRTSMAIDLSDEYAGAPPTQAKPASRPRAVSLDGQVEVSDAELTDPGLELGAASEVNDLDAVLTGGFGENLAPVGAAPLRATARIAAPVAAGAPAASGDVRLQLVLEVAGPAAQVEALISAVREKPIQIYPLTLCVKDPRR